ncbi:putative mitochondrial protein [Cucumis melo var. makuwa]|uniref:Mitochondrial protein n=1 Tax=Cucumis melo var. makuwa TaxID=1194695 RepID=A0A5A7T2K7_CUCMM|nr:putative mitochondrial protein [Cucumis melo var. makuwa]TYK13870.1 putative mitochondrial protein [Cucumis melo var. makuwa]
MQTQAKSGISKPKAFHITNALPTPTLYTEAYKYPEWRNAMHKEFNALQAQGNNVHVSTYWLPDFMSESYDIIVTEPDYSYISLLKNQLALEFKISNLGLLKYFLGLEIQSSIDGIFVNQAKYLNDLLHTSGMTSVKSCITPMSTSLDLNTIATPLNDPSLYRRLAVKRILRYLRGTPTLGIKFRKGSFSLQTFCDSDWTSDTSDRCSTSGFIAFLGSNPISWSSKKQSTISRSSIEAEYRSLATTTVDLYWIQQLLCDLHVSLKTSPTLWCDNVSAISLAHNPVFHAHTKHIEINYHFVREKSSLQRHLRPLHLFQQPTC